MSLIENLRKRPQVLGELLRNEFFKQDDPSDLGCVTTFDVREDVWRDPDELVEDYDEDELHKVYWKCFTKDVDHIGKVSMRYYWDGDGVIEFYLSDHSVLIENNDCKKTYCWFEVPAGSMEPCMEYEELVWMNDDTAGECSCGSKLYWVRPGKTQCPRCD